MRRRAIAAVWIFGATVPLLLAAAFLVGCCVLPFHALLHKLMPLCDMAAAVVRGDGEGGPRQNDTAPPPARQKDDALKRLAVSVPRDARAVASASRPVAPLAIAASGTTYRSFITLGAIRCDHDVGLHVLVELFRI